MHSRKFQTDRNQHAACIYTNGLLAVCYNRNFPSHLLAACIRCSYKQ